MNNNENERPNRKARKYGLGIGPLGDDPDEMIQTFCLAAQAGNKGQEIQVSDKKISPDNLFITFSVDSIEESKAICHYNGDQQKFITALDLRTWEQTTQKLNEFFDTFLINESTLDLSGLPFHGIENLYFPFNTSFVLFYCALRCKQAGVHIQKINFQKNGITNTEGFYPVSIYFPYLNTLILDSSVHVKDQFREAASQIEIIQTDETFEPTIEQPSILDSIHPPHISYPHTFLTDPERTERRVHYTLDMYQSIQLDPESFPAIPLIIQFYESAWNDISSLANFYASDSVFSISINYHSPYSFLSYYDKFSRNLLYSDKVNNVVKGSKNIVKAHKELFGDHFYSRVTSFNGSLIPAPHYITAVMHGVFQIRTESGEYLLGFDRTMLIFFNDENMAILNDHIFIHRPDPPGEE